MRGSSPRHDVKDLSLASSGVERILAAEKALPILHAIRARFASGRTFAGSRITACIDVTPGSAALLRALSAGGASIACCAADSGATDDAVAAALVAEDAIPVFAIADAGPETYWAHLDAAVDHRPSLLLDSGGALIGVLHADRREQLANVVAGIESTRIGALRLRTLEDDGKLAIPVVSTAPTSPAAATVIHHAAAQAAIEGVLASRTGLLTGAVVVVAGYGGAGRAVAARARGLSARVVVSDDDDVRALEATLDGYEVSALELALPEADVVVSALDPPELAEIWTSSRDGTVVANVAFDPLPLVELSQRPLTAAERGGGSVVSRATLDGRTLLLVEDGRPLGGPRSGLRPSIVEDVEVSLQALALEYALRDASSLPRAVVDVPHAVDGGLARLLLGLLARGGASSLPESGE